MRLGRIALAAGETLLGLLGDEPAQFLGALPGVGDGEKIF